MASCCETEESLNGRMRRISEAHKQTVTAGESTQSQGSQKQQKNSIKWSTTKIFRCPLQKKLTKK